MRKPGFSFLVFVGLVSGVNGCQSIQKAMLDDDCTSTRLTFWERETDDSLPSPKQASEEALLAMKDNEAQLLAARGSSLDDMEKGMHLAQDNQDWALSETQVFVPELLQREYFSSRSTKDNKNVERRKPLFARSQFGVEAASLDTPAFMPRTGLMARAGVPPVGSAMNTYEVAPGDTLGTISKKIYGTPGRWMELAHLNHLGNGSLIYPKEILFYIKDSQVIGQHE